VLFLTPCYFLPFVSAGYRKAYESELKVIEGRFYIDFEDVEKKLSLP
jgi:bifunctional pyridoxal-dependent enzyme with beta-cystathionase and maltose regulon repressor activities